MSLKDAREPSEILYLMGLGFEASFSFSSWNGTPKGMPNFGIEIPRGLILSKKKRARIKYIENSARENFHRYTFKTSFGDFLPFKAYLRWRIKHDKYKSFFELERDIFLAEYDSLPIEIKKEAEDWISKVFCLISGANEGTRPSPPFVERMIALMLSKVPIKKELSSFFDYRITLLPYIRLGISTLSGSWPSSRAWIGIAKEGLGLSKYSSDGFNGFTNEIALQYSKKCRDMLQYLWEIISRTSASHVVLTALSESLVDVEALNFFDDKEITRMVSEMRPLVKRETQSELESKLSDFLAYINSEYGQTIL